MLWWHCYPPKAPGRPNPGPVDPQIYPLTFAGRALTNGPPHLVLIGQPMGTLRSKVRAQPTTGSPPCRPDAAVSPLQAPATAPSVKGVTLRSRVPGVCTRHRTSTRVRGPSAKILWHCYPTKAPDHTRRHARNNPERGIFPHTSASQKIMEK